MAREFGGAGCTEHVEGFIFHMVIFQSRSIMLFVVLLSVVPWISEIETRLHRLLLLQNVKLFSQSGVHTYKVLIWTSPEGRTALQNLLLTTAPVANPLKAATKEIPLQRGWGLLLKFYYALLWQTLIGDSSNTAFCIHCSSQDTAGSVSVQWWGLWVGIHCSSLQARATGRSVKLQPKRQVSKTELKGWDFSFDI